MSSAFAFVAPPHLSNWLLIASPLPLPLPPTTGRRHGTDAIVSFSTLDTLFVIDNLKNVKSAWNNDLSAFKRAESNLKKPDQNSMMRNQTLHFFLANNNAVLLKLKDELFKCDSAVRDVLVSRKMNGMVL